ncbi:MAG: ABC transporter permease [Acidobacteria bacterium]|nr:MAG: ABC transporter permease [Acidobacteriota bacterium]
MNRLRFWFLLPAWVWIVFLFIAPLVIVCAYSLLTRGTYGGVELPWTLESYARILDPLYGAILLRSIAIAASATALCLVLAFPLALFISRSKRHKNLYLHLVILPFWTSFLVRTYAWLFLLRDTGLFNTVLTGTGVIRAPLSLLYNDAAVLIGLVYGFLPFMVLPLFATLERMDPSLLEAAADLGARPWAAFFRVIVPLSKAGIWAGTVLVFVPCLGAYLTPDLLGGGKAVMVGNLVQNQFTTARDWPFGSAISITLMLLATMALALFNWRAPKEML